MTDEVVFPTRVGMDLNLNLMHIPPPRIPHTRGDGPNYLLGWTRRCAYSPHAWGWTHSYSIP